MWVENVMDFTSQDGVALRLCPDPTLTASAAQGLQGLQGQAGAGLVGAVGIQSPH